jgi:hypothetical protein
MSVSSSHSRRWVAVAREYPAMRDPERISPNAISASDLLGGPLMARLPLRTPQTGACARRSRPPSPRGKCGPSPLTPSEISTLGALRAKGDKVTPDEAVSRQALLDTYMWRYEPNRQCRGGAGAELAVTAANRWAEEYEETRRKPPPPVAEDFDEKGLSGEDMAKRGKDAYKAERWDVAARWFRMAADLGDTEGMWGMYRIYRNGKGVPENDAEALRWLRMTAEHGSTDAMESLAYDYNRGEGVTQDYTEAMRWYRRAADMSSATAMMDVGELYYSGHGVPLDYSEAMRWFHKAADAGDSFAPWSRLVFYIRKATASRSLPDLLVFSR